MTNINNLTNAIMRELYNYSEHLTEQVEAAKKVSAEELQQELKTKGRPKRTGKYRENWTIKKDARKKAYVIYNKKHYRLTHLLEKGHAKRNGGRVPPIVHIAPAEDKAIRAYLERVERAIRG